MKQRVVVWSVIWLVGAACGGSGGSAPGPGPTTGPFVPGTLPPGPPYTEVVVVPVLDPGAATVQVVPPTGGLVSVTGSDGTTFYLTIPDGALVGPTEIRMRPLAEVGGLPMSQGLLGAVQLEPEGLSFLRPVTLEIVPPGFSVDAANACAFGYQRAGRDFHLTPSTTSSSSVTLELMHFSGAGVGYATPGDVAAQLANGAANGYEQQLAGVIDAAKRAGKSLGDPGVVAEMSAILDAWGSQLVYPALDLAATDDTLLEPAAQAFLHWDRQRALLGIGNDLADPASRGYRGLQKALRNAFVKANQRCQAGDPLQTPRIIAIDRAASLLGMDIGYSTTEAFAMARKCATFDLAFDSVVRVDDSRGQWWTSHTRADFRIQPDANLMWMEGTGTLRYLAYDDSNSVDNVIEAVLTDGQLTLDHGILRLGEDAGKLPEVILPLALTARTVEDLTFVDRQDGFRFHWGQSFAGWDDVWIAAHHGEIGFCDTCADTAYEMVYRGLAGTPAARHGAFHAEWVDGSGVDFATWRADDVIDLVHRPQR